MKRVYLLFLFSSCISLLLFSFLKDKRDELVYKENINNTEKLIEDSITPSCIYNLQNPLNSSYKNLEKLEIQIPKSRKWSRNQLNAFIGDPNIILDKYKKRFNSKIFIKNSSNEICILPARIRISGDWKDHIQSIEGNILSSLDVSLKEGNINGITKFKLFLPSTRNGASEVFISLLLKEMGYLSPRTNILEVVINNKSYEMIFQEKATKEMLEHNNLRESAILESDESLLWEIRSKVFLKDGIMTSNANNIFPRVINNKWIKKNSINQKIGLEGIKIFSQAILESWNHGGVDEEINYSDKLLSNGIIKNKKILSRFKAHLISSASHHALYNHNRRFYYDPLDKSLLPIYYDGNSKILNINKNFLSKDYKKRFITRDITSEDYSLAIKELKAIDQYKFTSKLNSAGLAIREKNVTKIINNLVENLVFLSNLNAVNLDLKFEKNPLKRSIPNNVQYGLVLLSKTDRNFYSCYLPGHNCNKINLNTFELNKLLTGEFTKKNFKYYFLSDKFDPVTKNYDENKRKLDLIKLGKNIYLRKFGNPKIYINKEEKFISIEIRNFDEKVVISDSKLEGWEIRVFAKEIDNKSNKSRIDSNLLTSLVTIKDSYVKNLKIYIDGGNHEDSLNIINTSGTIEKIDIKNSFQDAIDFDFSNLKVDEINVNEAGNDCIDLSSGEYYIKNLVLNTCKDKGISVGEKSTLRVKNAHVKNTYIGFVSKDSSKLIVENAKLKYNNFCIAAYNKKQEFGPSYISVPNKLCPKDKYIIQNLSTLDLL